VQVYDAAEVFLNAVDDAEYEARNLQQKGLDR